MVLRRSSPDSVALIETDEKIGAGGEAEIYSVKRDNTLAAKIYRKPSAKRESKLKAMIAHPPQGVMSQDGHAAIAWPIECLYTLDNPGQFAGFLMPRVTGMRPVFSYYNPAARRQHSPFFSYIYLHRTARNLASAIHALHAAGYMVGDLSESNVLVSPTALVTLVDADSFQVRDPDSGVLFRCTVGKPEYTAPELQNGTYHGADRRPEHDSFGLASLIFQLLMEGTHPFAGVYPGDEDPPPILERIQKGHFAYGAGPCTPIPSAPPIGVLGQRLEQLVTRSFSTGFTYPADRPLPQDWTRALESAEAALIACRKVKHHWYGGHLKVCPWCVREGTVVDPAEEERRRLEKELGRQREDARRRRDEEARRKQEWESAGPFERIRIRLRNAAEARQNREAPGSGSEPIADQSSGLRIERGVRGPWPLGQALLRTGIVAAVVAVIGVSARVIVGRMAEQDRALAIAHRGELEADAEIVRTALQSGRLEDVRGHLRQHRELVQWRYADGWTLLHFAAFGGQTEMAQLLISSGADIDSQEKDQFTPIHLAVQEGRVETVRELIERGAKVNATEKAGWTPLHFAADQGRLDLIRLLTTSGASLAATDRSGRTPLDVARSAGQSAAASLLTGPSR